MSSYLVLARKYRPSNFAEVIGQDSVTKLLRGAIQEGRIGHAYLFTGPRGTGKTTSARIFAKCLNCEAGPTPDPCGTCERCLAADAGSEVDIIELDAASHTGVDTIRELRDEVAYAPMRARHKVYIIDEVHMLSKAAFNALLKTLEEPPAHVVFLFATTEPHKVLDTILSRCQVLRLSALTEERICARLEEVFRLEGISAGEGVINELARGARGGMRDALSQADKLLALSGTSPSLEDLHSLGGDAGALEINALLGSIESADRGGLFSRLAGLHADQGALVAGLLNELRTSLILFHCGLEAPFVSATQEERQASLERVQRLGAERMELWMQELLRARERMRLLPEQSELILEACLLDLCRPETTIPLAELLLRLESLERGLGAPTTGARPAAAQPLSVAAPPAAAGGVAGSDQSPGQASSGPRGELAPQAPPAGAAVRSKLDLWKAFLAELRKGAGGLASLLDQKGTARSVVDEQTDCVQLRIEHVGPKEARLVTDKRNLAACSRAFSSVLGRQVSLLIVTPEEGQPAPDLAPEKPAGLGEDEFTEDVAGMFGGVIEELK